MTEYTLTSHDYDIRHKRTFLGWKQPSIEGVNPFFVSHSSQEDEGVNVKLVGEVLIGDEWKTKRVSAKNPGVVYGWPINGAVNLRSGRCLVINKRIRRQWRTSIYDDMIEVFDPLKEERDELSMLHYSGLRNKALLRAIFNNFYFTPTKAIERVVTLDRLAAAWDKEWLVASKFKPDKVCLFHGNNIVGTINEENGSVNLSKDLDFMIEELTGFGLDVRLT